MRLVNVILIIFLAVFLVYLGAALYRIDKVNFISPIYYGNRPVAIRVDLAGDGNFGANRNGNRKHRGVDILAEVGTPVYTPLGGVVINAEFEPGYGNYIEVMHKNGNVRTIYAHLLKIDVVKNQSVRQGQVIGYVGKTGNSRGRNVSAHLHFEIYKDGKLIDPSLYLE